ncbi:PREDICTED: THO complex subunit 2 isoform X2 [Nicrophorus vespilloides]|uniref:THO complex subunit 2 n=1 Tax=Nicrophorus vespilloides TaxID=110193 RepID=A0ABM1MN24_NICVS|nr:PREDICTED: THO complex subunit 2 isoform X2 [Nicrophorus vespilloides]
MADVLSPDIWKNWEKSGKNEFTKFCVQLIKDESKSPMFDHFTEIAGNLNDLIMNGINGAVKKESVVNILQELVTLHNDVPSIILDILNIADAETSGTQNDDSKERLNYCYIIKECEKFLSDKLLKERLEIDSLQEVGILKNRTFYTKFIKVKTKLYYKQRKFNLFREENEGFAKLVTELNQEFKKDMKHEELLDAVQSLIGCFNLDPNRVLDIILESFENKPDDAHLFIPLIKSYMTDPKTISEVLGSKFTLQKNSDAAIPRSLYVLAAHLLQYNIINLDDIYIWFSPDDKVMVKEWDKEMKDAKEYVRKLSIISINNKEKEESPEEKENPMEKYNTNQKLNLCEALLTVGDWETAQLLIGRLPEHYAVNQEPIAKALCNLLHNVIEPVYRSNWKMGNIRGKTIAPHRNPKAPKRAHTFFDLRDDAIPMLMVLGPSLHFDPILLYKIVRLSKVALLQDGIDATKPPPSEDSLYYDIVSLLDHSVLPALSYLDCNCSIAEEIWSLLKLYPYQTRYCLYSRWKNETYTIYPELLRKRGDSEKRIKNIMKRVSKENIKPAGRIIGKLTHSSPGFLFDYVLVQIQVYDNLIHPVVDSLKYLTNLSYDVLGFCLIESLANAEKKRVKHDSTSISNWLQSLSSFCGAVFKKYNIELTGLLQFVANQLKAQKSLDLLILKEIIQKMAGIDTIEDLTMDQLNAMSGGELLKVEAGYFSQVRNTKKSSLRLKDAMADQNLAVALCLLIAQQKYCIVYRETQQSHLKLVGKLSDQCQDTLVQFGTFLGSTLSVDEYVNKLPSIQSMLLEHHIPNEVAFFLARPMLHHAINIKYDQLRKADPSKKVPKNQKYYEAACEVMSPVQKSLIPLHLPKVWDDVSTQFLTTFWSLTMYDLSVPDETYQQAINKIKMASLGVAEQNPSKGKKEIERYNTLIEKLQEEKKKQHDHVEKVMYRLNQEKDSWFPSKSAMNDTITRFLQLCIFPRCTFTAIDAVYCAKFLHTIHALKTANFSTVLCYDRLFCDVTYTITSCTENEAMRYGRFLHAMLETLMRWHKSKDIFDKECSNFPGFLTKLRANNQSENVDQVGYENYRHVCHKWHYKLTKALIICLESKDYVQIRNALIVLIKIIPQFPVLIKLSQIFEKKIYRLAEEEKNTRQDLYTLAISYVGQLKNKIASGNIMHDNEFHHPEKEKAAKSVDSKTESKHNGDSKEVTKESRDKSDRKEKRQASEESRKSQNSSQDIILNERVSERERSKEESREKHNRKEEKREEVDRERERDREKRRERKEEKISSGKDERQYRDERYIEMVSPKDEMRYSGQNERYYDERSTSYFIRDFREERDVALNNGNNSGSSKHNQETNDPDREAKRRKMEGPSSKSYKHEDRKMLQQVEYVIEKMEKKERSGKLKDKREKLSDEEKELRKERKLGRKRDRAEEALQAEIKRKRDEEKDSNVSAAKMMHQNGELVESPHAREKYHHSREMSPYLRERERSHDRVEIREKHRRGGTEGSKRR